MKVLGLTILLSSLIIGLGFVFLGIKILLKKNGKFSTGHIGSSKAMADRGIKCATTQDREAQKTNKKI